MILLFIVVALALLAVGMATLGGILPWALFVALLLVAAGTIVGWRTFRGTTGGRRLSDGV